MMLTTKIDEGKNISTTVVYSIGGRFGGLNKAGGSAETPRSGHVKGRDKFFLM